MASLIMKAKTLTSLKTKLKPHQEFIKKVRLLHTNCWLCLGNDIVVRSFKELESLKNVPEQALGQYLFSVCSDGEKNGTNFLSLFLSRKIDST